MSALHSRITGPVLRRVIQPHNILEMGMAFWSTRAVVAAVEFGVFTQLAAGPLSGQELMDKLGLHPQAAEPVLDALVVLGLLRRDRAGRYSNSRRTALFLDRAKPSQLGGLMGLSSRRLFNLWSSLGDLLQTRRPGAAQERGDNAHFSALCRDPAALRSFLVGMTEMSTGEAALIAARFPWKRFRSFVDIGAAQGALPVHVALTHPHLTGASYDVAAVGPIFEEYVESFALSERLRFIPGDVHNGPLPTGHVICFGHVLHGYGETKRRELIAKAYDAVPIGGAVIVYDAMVDPARPHNFTTDLSSLNIMLETREGFEATTTQCSDWLRAAGFVGVTTCHLIGPTSMVFGYKPRRVPSEA
jgi:O-methyltransferase domain/Dimerisation domain